MRVVEQIDSASLSAYALLKDAVAELGSEVPPYQNIAALFFHDILSILSSYAYRRVECANGLMRRDLSSVKLRTFPYVDYQDVQTGIDVSAKTFARRERDTLPPPNPLLRILSLASGIGSKKATVGVLPNVIPRRAAFKHLHRAGYTVVWPRFAPIGAVNVPAQWRLLHARLMELAAPLGATPTEMERLADLVHRHVSSHVRSEPSPLKCDILVSGSHTTRSHRLMAAQARSQGMPVLTVRHGEADGMLDEPVFGYGEYTFATHILSYGQAAAHEQRSNTYRAALYEDQDPPRVVPSNSDVVLACLKPGPIEAIKPGARLFYVPTMYSGFETYGPFRSLPDELYRRWQENVLRQFPEAILKLHPKGNNWFPHSLPVERVENRDLRELLDNADGFLFDYISTAFTLAAATDKPIVYFDVGVRNPTAGASRAIGRRCTVICVTDLLDPFLRERTFSAAATGNVPENTLPTLYSLDGTPRSRLDTFIETIDELCKQGFRSGTQI